MRTARHTLWIVALVGALAASACSDGDDDPDANVQIDSGSTDDASTVDGAPVDAPTMDARATDALAYDAQTYDGPFPDAFPIDATVPDAAFPDAFPPDAMLPDAMPPDAMVPAFCGDGTCNEGECNSCFADCPDGCFCPHDECTEGVALDALCGECTTQICAVDSFCCQTAWDGACVNEVETVCNKQCPSVCGDFVCDVDEDCSTCENDCGVCQVCGDNQCVGAECSTCPADCPNGCNCPHDECTEGAALDEGCSACVEDICAQDPFCCQTAWDGLCVSEVSTICGNTCP